MRSSILTPPEALHRIPPENLNIMGYVNESEVNGPGCRAVVWVQGCLLHCPGCFNPASWAFEDNQLVTVDDLVARIVANPHNQGVTFSGGEPFWQAAALAQVAARVKAQGLNVMSFTGFTLETLRSPAAPPVLTICWSSSISSSTPFLCAVSGGKLAQLARFVSQSAGASFQPRPGQPNDLGQRSARGAYF